MSASAPGAQPKAAAAAATTPPILKAPFIELGQAAAYDPLARAYASRRKIANREAGIPPQCYTKTDGISNPCWTCHTEGKFPNVMSDWHLQMEYAFSDEGLINHWSNLFVDRSATMDRISDADVLAYIRADNYEPLRQTLAKAGQDYPGFRPDLDLQRGFEPDGFARDGSAWRAFRYKPFPGAFWPTNGATDDVFIRLPLPFRQRKGVDDKLIYRANLALLEASFSADPNVEDAQVRWPCEPLDERRLGHDLDGDGKLSRRATHVVGLPAHYFGDAAEVPVRRALYPEDTEFLHSVRYVDPDAVGLIAPRMKELRYAKKRRELERWAILRQYELELDGREEARLPSFGGEPAVGLVNNFGWQLQGFIEDAHGRLRLQTHEEHLACMGCHSNIGVTLDQTFSFARKVPGRAGWAYQNIDDLQDVPQLGHAKPEVLTYFERVRGGDEFRANDEVLARFFDSGGNPIAERVRRAAPGGDQKLPYLLAPSRERALDLDRAYMALVRAQDFEHGRDTVIRPARNVHTKIVNGQTELEAKNMVFTDGQLRLDWSATPFLD